MRRTLCSIVIGLLASSAILSAQQTHIDKIYVDTRASFHQDWKPGEYNSHFHGDYLNLHMLGQISDKLTFRVRQRLNKKIDDQNPFNATDFLWLKYQFHPKWSVTAGKQAILVGTYEVDSAPIDVYYYGTFVNNWYQYYAFGVNVTYTPAPGQSIVLQFCPSPISPAKQNAYSYNLYWNGHIGPNWKTTWSYNYVEDETTRMMNWIALGNRFFMGPLALDVDFINRASFQQKRFFFSDWTLIGKAILTLGKWNLCTKVGYERNDASNVDASGASYDLILPAGNDYFYYGAGVEFFPLGGDHLRLHAVWFRDNHDRINNFDLGITWRFNIYNRTAEKRWF